MEQIEFVSIEELKQQQYKNFLKLADFESDHPLHRLYVYVIQYYGGLRKDVVEFFCDTDSMKKLARMIEADKGIGLWNEWYRRMVRLLQCHASAEWYGLFCFTENKPICYTQYFQNQLVSYVEQELNVFEVKEVFLRNQVAYLLEYEIRQLKKKDKTGVEQTEFGKHKIHNDVEPIRVETQGNFPDIQSILQSMMKPMIDSQNQLQEMLRTALNCEIREEGDDKTSEKITPNQSEEEKDALIVADGIDGWKEDTLPTIPDAYVEKEQDADTQNRQEKINHYFKVAKLFQQTRIKRKVAQMKRMDKKQQVQELVLQMNQKEFSTEDISLVRNLMQLDVSLELLCSIVMLENEPVERLKKIYDFLSYEATIETQE